ncbi:MAG: hypothetical protein IJW46_01895 [Clostridia bacterium]|nr:hypothetical protein [Clostridia bacterium]
MPKGILFCLYIVLGNIPRSCPAFEEYFETAQMKFQFIANYVRRYFSQDFFRDNGA